MNLALGAVLPRSALGHGNRDTRVHADSLSTSNPSQSEMTARTPSGAITSAARAS